MTSSVQHYCMSACDAVMAKCVGRFRFNFKWRPLIQKKNNIICIDFVLYFQLNAESLFNNGDCSSRLHYIRLHKRKYLLKFNHWTENIIKYLKCVVQGHFVANSTFKLADNMSARPPCVCIERSHGQSRQPIF